jgi:hypothetical protein
VKVQRAFPGNGGIPPPSARGRRVRQRSPPRGRNSFPLRNKPSRTDCGALRPSYTARHRAGRTKIHRPRKGRRTAREATNYPAPMEIAVRDTRVSLRRPGLSGWEPRSMSYAPFVERIAQSPQWRFERRFSGATLYRPRWLGDVGERHRSRHRRRNSVPRRNEHNRTDCGALRPSYTARHRSGSTTTHRARKVPRTARDATNYHAPKEIAVRATREPRRRPGIFGSDPRSMSYALFRLK